MRAPGVTTFGPDRASCEVLVFREGVLSAVGHDLLLRVTALDVAVDPAAPSVVARLDAGSLRVVTALRDGKPLPGALSASDVADVERTVATKVLRAERFPEVRFVSSRVRAESGDPASSAAWSIAGSLTVGGATREISFRARREGGRLVAEVTLHQPSFGIQPYGAMLGALRVKPDVVVRASLPAAYSSS